MKLRIKGNSLRLRITPSELNRLLETGRIEETIHFASGENARLTYALEHAADASSIGVRYSPQEVALVLSSRDVRRWAGAQDVGLYAEVPTSHGPLGAGRRKGLCLSRQGRCGKRRHFSQSAPGNRLLIATACAIASRLLTEISENGKEIVYGKNEYDFRWDVRIRLLWFAE